MSSASSLSRVTTPPDFAKASPAYRFRVWMAMLGLLLFVAVYVGLASWFTYTTYRMITGVMQGGESAVFAFFAAIPSAFLAIFMWKALFFMRQGDSHPGVEITASDHPELFEFLYQLADEVGAPRPHRVFLSPNVNAAVFYDLSILNFILPSKKNLVIGVGLVNALERSEFRAVLAHEFGHFAQRSMAVGRWVYVGEQIAGHIIAKRDALDRALDFLSSIDLRVAWIGWIMRTVVWSIRSLMETVFRWVVIAHRALSREMEFQADLVAVSVTGSDALIHALYKLQPADEDWQRSLDFANEQLGKGKVVTDLCAVQTRIGEQMRRVLNEPTHGKLPAFPAGEAASRRLFTEKIAQPPNMWSTHPPNTEREANAKRVYIAAWLNEDSAWTLFENRHSVSEIVTQFLFDQVKLETKPEPLTAQEMRAALDRTYSHESYDTAYRGAYLGRSVTRGVADAGQLIGSPPAPHELALACQRLYPPQLHDQLTQWRNLEEEIALLQAIEDGVFDASGGVIRHRGEVVKRAKLPVLIEQIRQERDEVLRTIEDHDRHCRTVHLALAQEVGQGWKNYLNNLTHLLHYAEHSHADLQDAHGQLANITMMATAAGRVSSGKLKKILAAANDLHAVMTRVHRQAIQLDLPPAVLRDLEVATWREMIPNLELPPADQHNIGEWIKVIDSWALPMVYSLEALRNAVLQELLRAEKLVAQVHRGEQVPLPAPSSAKVPASYPTLPRGKERERQKKLDWWSRFTLAEGTAPSILRFVVAASIVAAVITAGMYVGNVQVIIYNGLATPVLVQVQNQEVSLGPQQHKKLSMATRRSGLVTARTPDGRQIESFEADLDRSFAKYVYNVAHGTPLVEWTQVYGDRFQPPPEILGAPRWRTTQAHHIFEQPPLSVETSSSGATRLVLSSFGEMSPQQILQARQDLPYREQLIRAHARWDVPRSRYILYWLYSASELPEFDQLIAARLADDPGDVATLRIVQDTAAAEKQAEVRERLRKQAQQHPDDADWQYIGIRAMPDGPEQDQAFLEAADRWPENAWLSNAASYIHASQARWQQALDCLDVPLRERGPLFELAAVHAARIRRLLAAGDAADLGDLRGSIELDQHLSLESGENLQGTPAYAYSLLNLGQVEEAMSAAGGVQADPSLQILLATSQGADPQWQQQALELPIEEIRDPRLLLYLAALAVRNGKSSEEYLQKFDEHYPDAPVTLLGIVRKLIEQGGPGQSLEEELTGLEPMSRGLVLATVIIMYPDQAQDSWRRAANALLFAAERPAL